MTESVKFAPGQVNGAAWQGKAVLDANHLRKDFPLGQMPGGRRVVQAVEDASLTLYA